MRRLRERNNTTSQEVLPTEPSPPLRGMAAIAGGEVRMLAIIKVLQAGHGEITIEFNGTRQRVRAGDTIKLDLTCFINPEDRLA